jgi:hypothetical protein
MFQDETLATKRPKMRDGQLASKAKLKRSQIQDRVQKKLIRDIAFSADNIGPKACDVPPISKDGKSKPGSLRGIITEVITHNTSHTRIKHMKYSES